MKTPRYLRARHSLPVESPDILHNGHRYRHVPFLPERRPAATGRIKTDWQLGNIQAAAPMPITSPGNDDDTGENHQPTLRKNTAEPVEQTLKQNTFPPLDALAGPPVLLHRTPAHGASLRFAGWRSHAIQPTTGGASFSTRQKWQADTPAPTRPGHGYKHHKSSYRPVFAPVLYRIRRVGWKIAKRITLYSAGLAY